MVIHFYRRSSIQSAIVLPVLLIGLWIFAFLNPSPVAGRHFMPLYELVVFLTGQLPFVTYFISIALIFAEGLLLNSFVVKHDILNTNSYMVALLYAVLMSASPSMLSMHPVIFSNLFLILALNKIMLSYRKEKAYYEVFDAGIFIALATLFYFPAFVFFPIIWVGLILIRPFIWREWVIAIIGFFIPYIFTWTYYFWHGLLSYFWYDKLFYPLPARYLNFDFYYSYYFLIGTFVLIYFLSCKKLFKGLTMSSVRSRNNLWVLIWTLALCIISFLIAPSFSVKYFSFAAIPISVQAANYFLSSKKIGFAEITFYLLLSAIIINHCNHFFQHDFD